MLGSFRFGSTRVAAPTRRVDPAASTKPIEEDFELLEEIGKGAFSVVRKAKEISTERMVAVKTIDKRKQKDFELFQQEITIMRLLKGNSQVVSLIETYEDDTHLNIVMELVSGGELFEKIVAKGFYSENDGTHIIRQILEGIAYCHARNVVHRDLKPENLLCETADPDDLSDVKISDFGLARQLKPGQTLSGRYGSPVYMAPEIVSGEEYGLKIDMWSLGVISYILLGGYPPFSEQEGRPSLDQQITLGLVTFDEDSWADISSKAKDFISKLLIVDTEKRMSAEQALNHPIFKKSSARKSTVNRVNVLNRIKKFNARRKFRAFVYTVISINRMKRITHFTSRVQREIKSASFVKLPDFEGLQAGEVSPESGNPPFKLDPNAVTGSARLFLNTNRALISETRTITIEEGKCVLEKLPRCINTSTFYVRSVDDPKFAVSEVRVSGKDGRATLKVQSAIQEHSVQLFYDVENLLCKIGYNAVVSADATSIDLTGFYTISNNCGRDIALDKCVLERFEDNVTLQDCLVLADGEAISISFVMHESLPIEFNEATAHPIRLMLDNKSVIGVDVAGESYASLKRKLWGGSVMVYQASRVIHKPQVFVSSGALVNAIEPVKPKRAPVRQKSLKRLNSKQSSVTKVPMARAQSVKTLGSKKELTASPNGTSSARVSEAERHTLKSAGKSDDKLKPKDKDKDKEKRKEKRKSKESK